MLVVSDKRLVPVQINTTVLQGEDGEYYYLHRDLYDQLTILWDQYQYGDAMHLLAGAIKEGVGAPEIWPENIRNFYFTVPAPLKAAAPFLFLIDQVDELETIEDMCGALTVISMSINLRRITKVDRSIRAALTFSLHVREEYKPHWDRFFQENPEFGEAVTLPTPRPTTTQVPTPDGGMIVVDEETGEEEEIVYTSSPSEIDWGAMMADLTADMAPASTPEPATTAPASSSTPASAGGGSGFDLFGDM